MQSLILTPEQKAMRAYEARHSEAGQVATIERAIGRAVDGVSQDLSAEGGKPSYTAALGGLLNAVAGHLALLEDGDRQRFIAQVQVELPHQVEARVAMAAQVQGRG